jgi:hypothetical protein
VTKASAPTLQPGLISGAASTTVPTTKLARHTTNNVVPTGFIRDQISLNESRDSTACAFRGRREERLKPTRVLPRPKLD